MEIFDSSREAFYYWNQLSGNVQWEKPDSFIQANDDLFIRSALKIQSSFRGAIERKINLKKQKQNDEYSKDSTDTENNQIKAKERGHVGESLRLCQKGILLLQFYYRSSVI